MRNRRARRWLRLWAVALVTTASWASQNRVAATTPTFVPAQASSGATRSAAGDQLDLNLPPSEFFASAGRTASHAVADSVMPSRVSRLAEFTARRPHVLDGAVSDVIVQVLGSLCTGTPVTGTVYVVTAAHCVLTPKGNVIQRTVMRDGVEYHPVAVLVDTDYARHPREAADAAVLVMAQRIPGRSVRVGLTLPVNGYVTLAGYQPVDSSGGLMRGHDIDDHPRRTDPAHTRDHSHHQPAGCVTSVSELDVSTSRVVVPCGLVPGASGGGLFAQLEDELLLVGIVSTVTADVSANGIAPVASLRRLLDHPGEYVHKF